MISVKRSIHTLVQQGFHAGRQVREYFCHNAAYKLL